MSAGCQPDVPFLRRKLQGVFQQIVQYLSHPIRINPNGSQIALGIRGEVDVASPGVLDVSLGDSGQQLANVNFLAL